MPVPCPSNSGLSSASFSSNLNKKPTMFGGSDPLLCKSNNNKISDQNENGRCVNGNGYLDNGRRRACSASNALNIAKQKNGYGSAHLLNGYTAAQSRQHCRDICMLLAYDIIRMKSKKEDASWLGHFTSNGVHQIENEYTKTLRRTVSEISQRHEILFTSMVKKLNLSRENFEELFISVVDDIFSDGHLNWGRIVTVYALEGKIAEYMSNNGLNDCLSELAEKVGSYVDDVIGDWIMDNGGWDAFVRFFPDRTGAADEKLWNGLVLGAACGIVGAAGLATLFAMKT